MNIEQLRIAVRRDLRDEEAERWNDAELDRHIAHAVRDYSEHLPCEQTAVLPTISGSRDIDISSLSSRVNVVAVQYPVGGFPARWQPFSVWADTLTLLGADVPDGSDACLYYGSLHHLDSAGTTVPASHEDIIASGACGYAAIAGAVNAVNRVNAGGIGTPADYLAWGRERLAWFRSEVRRLGWRNRVRPGVLFSTSHPVVSRFAVYSNGGER